MTEDTINGAQMLLERIDAELAKKKLTADRRLLLEIKQYNLRYTVQMRTDIAVLKKHDILQRMQTNPKLSFAIVILLLLLNGMVNWAGIRRPLLQTIIYQVTGMLLPIDSIP